MLFRFGTCELDTDTVELRSDGVPLAIEPQVYELIAYLLQNRNRVVSKDELLDKIWSSRFVSESALTSRVKSARRAVGDDGRAQRVIRTVHGRGYRFVAAVEQAAGTDGTGTGTVSVSPQGSPLPVPPNELVGRERELTAVCGLLARRRLVTLLGPGGVGKTRLAVEAAARVAAQYRDGVCFVELTRARAEKEVPDLVVEALGFGSGPTGDPVRIVEESLRGRSMLLVFDNFEHVVDAAPLVSELLEHAPEVRVITTSRERLRLRAEHVFEVSPLPVESNGGVPDAVALFEQVARANDPSFSLDGHNLADVAAMCRAVDGLPLGIELVAGQIRVLPPALLRARMRFPVGELSDGLRDRPRRHQTIRDTLDWSLNLLPDAEHRLFGRMAVFTGPMPLHAIAAVCGDERLHHVDPLVGALVDKSLVQRTRGRDGHPRFGMLELVREYAGGLLVAAEDYPAVHDRHAEYVADRLDEIEYARWGEAAGSWIDEVNELAGEIHAARARALNAGNTHLAARIVASLYCHWRLEGRYDEGRSWTAEALAHEAALDPPIAGKLRLAAGYMDYYRHDISGARTHWEHAARLFDPVEHPRWRAFSEMSVASTDVGDPDRFDAAMMRCDDAIAVARSTATKPLVAHGLNVKGELARLHGDDDVARAAYEEGLALCRAAGDTTHSTVFMVNLSYLAQHRGDHALGRELGREALRICWTLGRRLMAAWTVSHLAGPELGLGHPERAALMIGAGDEALRVIGAERGPADQPEHARVLAGLETILGAERLLELQAKGRAMRLEDAVGYALSDG